MNKSMNKKFVAAFAVSLLVGIVFGSQLLSATNDGNLLRRTNQDENTCGGPNNACHNLKPHNATNTESTYWSSNWGNTSTSKYGKFVCQTCHTPHNTKNIYLIREKVKFPDSSTMPSGANESPVDLRYLSASTYITGGDSNHPANFVLGNDDPTGGGTGRSSSTRICEVCHSQTAHHRYNTSGQTDGFTHNNALACVECHLHSAGFKKPAGGAPADCEICHPIQWNAMNGSDTSKYNMYLTNTDYLNYPTQDVFGSGDTESSNRKCIMCHAKMLDFFDTDGTDPNKWSAKNLRRSILEVPGVDGTQFSDTDFIESMASDSTIRGGICTSCHLNSQYKKNVSNATIGQGQTDADSTTVTPIINPALFVNSSHNFQVESASFGDGTTFKANCLKCHNEYPENGASKMTGAGRKFAPHSSTIRRLNAPMSLTLDYGTASSGGANTLADSTKAWTTNTWKGRPVTIVAGTGRGQTRLISSNTGNTLTLSSAWTTTPDTTSKYSLGDPAEEEFCFNCHSTTRNPNYASKKDFYGVQTVLNGKMFKMEDMFRTYTGTNNVLTSALDTACGTPSSGQNLNDTTATWTANQWASSAVRIVSGTGAGQIRRIISNSATKLCLDKDFTTQLTTTSTYEIGQIRHRIEQYAGVHRTDEAVNAEPGPTSTPAGWFASVSGGTHNGCTDCHNPHAQKKGGEDNGTATGGSLTTLTDSTKSWTTDQWRGYTLRLMDGTGAGQDRMITANGPTTLTVGGGAASGGFSTAPTLNTFYVIVPSGLPGKGNNLSGPNNGQWGVDITPANYPAPAITTSGTLASPTFTKNTSLVSGTDKIYELCFKCHSDYGWGTGGTPFNIVDVPSTQIMGMYKTAQSTNIANEFNPKNLGYHPVVDIGANQPITIMGDTAQNIAGPFTASGGTVGSTSLNPTITVGTPQTWNPTGNCVEITSGTGAGQIRSVAGYTTTSISTNPAWTTLPTTTSVFYVRKCSAYNNGANYAAVGTAIAWPRFSGGTITLSAGSNTATISGLAVEQGIPSTVIPGWYIYAGTLYTAVNANVMPSLGTCSATAPCPPMLSTSGWFQITSINANASGSANTGSATVTITPTPEASYTGQYALTAGLGNAFVPPFGPWSVIACTDCHDTDNPQDPSGPHGSASPWILRKLEAQSFPWFYGGENSTTSTTNANLVRTISYPEATTNTTWPGVGVPSTGGNTMANYLCLNCHRPDVYGFEDNSPTNGTAPIGAGFTNMGWKVMSRVPHLPDSGHGGPKDSDGTAYWNSYGIMCMHCHAGDARAGADRLTANTEYKALGGVHGSNNGLGPFGTSYTGRRLLNGATWVGVTRSSTGIQMTCYTKAATTGISGCGQHTGGASGYRANYPYYSSAD